MAMASLPRSWQDLGNATKELAMDLGKDAMVSNTGSEQSFCCSLLKLDHGTGVSMGTHESFFKVIKLRQMLFFKP